MAWNHLCTHIQFSRQKHFITWTFAWSVNQAITLEGWTLWVECRTSQYSWLFFPTAQNIGYECLKGSSFISSHHVFCFLLTSALVPALNLLCVHCVSFSAQFSLSTCLTFGPRLFHGNYMVCNKSCGEALSPFGVGSVAHYVATGRGWCADFQKTAENRQQQPQSLSWC